MDYFDIETRFVHHPPSAEKARLHAQVRTRLKNTAHSLNILLEDGREKSLALTGHVLGQRCTRQGKGRMSHHSPRHKTIADGGRILLTEVGSGLHGVAISGTDDHDEMGICIPPPSCVIGLENFEQYQDRWHEDGTRIGKTEEGHDKRSGPGDTDHVTYALNKWARLAAAGNPTVIMPLFAPNKSVQEINEYGMRLRDNRHLFISKEAGRRFYGYLIAQKQRMLGERGRKHTNRPELIELYGFDTKFAYHALRLAFQGVELLTDGHITLPMTDFHVKYLRDVRQGKYTLEEVVDEINWQAGLLDATTRNSDWPEHADYEVLNEFLVEMHTDWWAKKGIL